MGMKPQQVEEGTKLDWYTYLTDEFKIDRSLYRVNDRYPFTCTKCGNSKVERLNHVKAKIKLIGFYECSKCRISIKEARKVFKDKYGDVNPYQLEKSKRKIKKTNLERHGVDCILKKPEVHAKGIEAAKRKRDKERNYEVDFSIIKHKSNRNSEDLKLWMKEYSNIRKSEDPQYVPKRLIYSALCRMMKGCKLSKTNILKNIGYTPQELRTHLENQFKPGMTWNNHGKWHLDHIKPLSLFDCTDINQIIEANQLENLQPLWAGENLKKSNKY